MVQGIQHDSGKPGSGCADILFFNGQDQELGFHKSIVSSFQLPAEHLGVQVTDTIEPVTLGSDLDTLYEILLIHVPTGKGNFHADGTVMGIVKVTEGFKDSRLVVRLSQLIIYILKRNAPGPGGIIQFTQPIRVHLPEG